LLSIGLGSFVKYYQKRDTILKVKKKLRKTTRKPLCFSMRGMKGDLAGDWRKEYPSREGMQWERLEPLLWQQAGYKPRLLGT
jgi:hypothetical protein